MKPKPVSLLFLAAAFAAGAAAYDHPLDSSAIRDAYFLGTDSRRSAEFLARYAKRFPSPKSGAYVAEIAVRTPFAQVVEMSREHSVGYNALQAEQDYRKNPSVVQVRVQILLGPINAVASQVIPSPGCQGVQRMNSALECFHDFRFSFRQKREVAPQQTYGVPIYSLGDASVLTGGDVWFSFRTSDVASAPLRVTVTAPDGQKISAEFDLSSLR